MKWTISGILTCIFNLDIKKFNTSNTVVLKFADFISIKIPIEFILHWILNIGEKNRSHKFHGDYICTSVLFYFSIFIDISMNFTITKNLSIKFIRIIFLLVTLFRRLKSSYFLSVNVDIG